MPTPLETLKAALKSLFESSPATREIAANGMGDAIDAYGGTAGIAAGSLMTTGAAVDVKAAVPPVAGRVLASTDPTHATWQLVEAVGAMSLLGWPTNPAGGYFVSLSYAARQVTITPSTATFDFWVRGVKFTKTGAQTSIAHADTTGTYFVAYDNTGSIVVSTSFWDLELVCPVAFVFYNATLGVGICFHELHTWMRSPLLHNRLHSVEGTQISTGFTIGAIIPASDVNANKRPTFTEGTFFDEDIKHTHLARAAGSYTIFERIGASGVWSWTTGNADFFLTSATFAQINNFTGGVWTKTTMAHNEWANYYVFVMPAISTTYQLAIVPGQAKYATLAAAQAEVVQLIDWGTAIPFQEIAAVYQITIECKNAYASQGKCVIPVAPVRIVTSRSKLSTSSLLSVPAHATSHQHLGSDEIATATPAANAIPKADAAGKLDAWVTPSSGGGRVVALLSSSHLILSGGATYALGQFYIDPAWATGMSMRFCAEARITDAAETGSLVLWDLVADEAITGSLAFTGSLDFEHDAAALTVGAGAGEIKLTARLYEIRAAMSGAGLATRYMDLANAYVEVY